MGASILREVEISSWTIHGHYGNNEEPETISSAKTPHTMHLQAKREALLRRIARSVVHRIERKYFEEEGVLLELNRNRDQLILKKNNKGSQQQPTKEHNLLDEDGEDYEKSFEAEEKQSKDQIDIEFQEFLDKLRGENGNDNDNDDDERGKGKKLTSLNEERENKKKKRKKKDAEKSVMMDLQALRYMNKLYRTSHKYNNEDEGSEDENEDQRKKRKTADRDGRNESELNTSTKAAATATPRGLEGNKRRIKTEKQKIDDLQKNGKKTKKRNTSKRDDAGQFQAAKFFKVWKKYK